MGRLGHWDMTNGGEFVDGSSQGCLFSRQHKLEEALLFSGQFMDALQALVDWLYKVEPQLAEDQPVHGDLDLVMNLMDAHKVRAPFPALLWDVSRACHPQEPKDRGTGVGTSLWSCVSLLCIAAMDKEDKNRAKKWEETFTLLGRLEEMELCSSEMPSVRYAESFVFKSQLNYSVYKLWTWTLIHGVMDP